MSRDLWQSNHVGTKTKKSTNHIEVAQKTRPSSSLWTQDSTFLTQVEGNFAIGSDIRLDTKIYTFTFLITTLNGTAFAIFVYN